MMSLEIDHTATLSPMLRGEEDFFKEPRREEELKS